jgi:hypothetical protein
MSEAHEEKIAGGKVQYYGSDKDHPCGVQIVGKSDYGRDVLIDFEVFSCKDLAIRQSSLSVHFPESAVRLDPEEVINALLKGFRHCGCSIKVTESLFSAGIPN